MLLHLPIMPGKKTKLLLRRTLIYLAIAGAAVGILTISISIVSPRSLFEAAHVVAPKQTVDPIGSPHWISESVVECASWSYGASRTSLLLKVNIADNTVEAKALDLRGMDNPRWPVSDDAEILSPDGTRVLQDKYVSTVDGGIVRRFVGLEGICWAGDSTHVACVDSDVPRGSERYWVLDLNSPIEQGRTLKTELPDPEFDPLLLDGTYVEVVDLHSEQEVNGADIVKRRSSDGVIVQRYHVSFPYPSTLIAVRFDSEDHNVLWHVIENKSHTWLAQIRRLIHLKPLTYRSGALLTSRVNGSDMRIICEYPVDNASMINSDNFGSFAWSPKSDIVSFVYDHQLYILPAR